MRRLALPLLLLLAGCTANVNAVVAPGGTVNAPGTAASAKPSAKPAKAELPAAGSQVDAAFWQANHPPVAKGTVWTYVSAWVNNGRPGEETPVDAKWELTEVAGALLTFTTTDVAPGGAASDRTMTVEGKVGPLVPGADLPWTYFGPEDVTVPMGTYKGALKLIAADASIAGVVKTGGTLWLVPDVGVVKLQSNGEYHFRQELKAIKKP